jgi:CO/xanthine dehydrogenase FAD-binding subunit
MSRLKYHRPKTLDETLELLKSGRPLAGGTRLVPNRRDEHELIDLQGLGLDALEVNDDHIKLGAMVRLQDLVASEASLPSALIRACRLEAGLHIRHMATVGGSLMAGDGRSPFLTTMLPMEASLAFAGQETRQSLDELLDDREAGGLLTEIRIRKPDRVVFDQVARSPADRPILCACVVKYEDQYNASLGGYGHRPLLIGFHTEAEELEGLAIAAFAEAQDQWASSEYRSHVAGRLISRLAEQVGSS